MTAALLAVFAFQAAFFIAWVLLMLWSCITHKEWWGTAFIVMLLLACIKLDFFLFGVLFP